MAHPPSSSFWPSPCIRPTIATTARATAILTEPLPGAAPALHRALNPTGVLLLTLSALSPVGSVYITGAGVLHLAGSGAALAFIVGGVISAIMALLYAELGAAFPGAGGIYASLARILGPAGAFPCIALQMVTGPPMMAFTAMGLADYVRVLAPHAPYIPIALGTLALACLIGVLRIRTGALVTGLFLVVEAVALAIMTIVALAHPTRPLRDILLHPVYLDHGALAPVPWATMGLAVVAGIYATAGANWALFFGEEMHDAPSRLGRVTAWAGVLASITITIPMVLMLMSTPDLRSMLAAEAPIAAFLASTGGQTAAAIVSIGVIAAIFNNQVALGMALARFMFATGRDGIWPGFVNRAFAHLHRGWKSPVQATIILCLVSAAAIALGERVLLIIISGNVFEYLLMAVAMLAGRRAGTTGRLFRVALHPALPCLVFALVAAFVVADWMDPDAGRPSMLLLSAVFVASLAYCRLRLRGRVIHWT
jgi:amino acid transporter